MPATNPPPLRRDDPDDAQANSEEVRMRLALEKLSTRSTPPARRGAGIAAGVSHTVPQRRQRFVREGDVPVEPMLAPVCSPAEMQWELEEAPTARQRAEQALSEAQAKAGTLQVARAAREAVEEWEAAMVRLHAELQHATVQLMAALADKPAARARVGRGRSSTARAKAKRIQAKFEATRPQPVKWWLHLTQPRT